MDIKIILFFQLEETSFLFQVIFTSLITDGFRFRSSRLPPTLSGWRGVFGKALKLNPFYTQHLHTFLSISSSDPNIYMHFLSFSLDLDPEDDHVPVKDECQVNEIIASKCDQGPKVICEILANP